MKLAHASGKLVKGGEPDLNTAAKMVLYDWQRGKIPFFKLPPDYTPDGPPGAAGVDDVGVAAAAAAGVAEASAVDAATAALKRSADEAAASPEQARSFWLSPYQMIANDAIMRFLFVSGCHPTLQSKGFRDYNQCSRN